MKFKTLMNKIYYKKIDPNVPDIITPEFGNSGIDLYTTKELILFKDEWMEVKTGVAVEIPVGFCGLVMSRSGTRFNYRVFCSLGLIDSSYRGEIKLLLRFEGNNLNDFDKGDARLVPQYSRIAQLLVIPVVQPELLLVTELSKSKRGEKGFGSSGD